VRDITYLGLSTTLFEIAQQSNIFSFALVTLTLLALLSPVIALVNIVLASQRPNTNKDHSTKRVYEHSLVDCIVRAIIYTFPYFGLPLLVSFAAKLTQLSTTLTVFAALILILAIVNCLISEYHSFELGDHQ
jgi:NADH:ubiquinone oxidoreductase subunit 2 (subunit N)